MKYANSGSKILTTYYLILSVQKQGSFTVSCLQVALHPDPNSNVIVPVLFRLSSSTFFWVVHVFFFQPVSILVLLGIQCHLSFIRHGKSISIFLWRDVVHSILSGSSEQLLVQFFFLARIFSVCLKDTWCRR